MGERVLRLALALLAGAGLAISAYLSWVHLLGVAPACVGGSGGCEAVQASRYSEILGIPVAALGVLAYGWLLLSATVRGTGAVLSGLLVALICTLFSAYLTYLEIFVIRAICQWCVASALTASACLIVAVLRFRQG